MKNYLSSPPFLAKPELGEKLFLYLIISPVVIEAILIRKEAKIQKPIYYISRVLMDAETRYTKLEKLTYALLITTKKL